MCANQNQLKTLDNSVSVKNKLNGEVFEFLELFKNPEKKNELVIDQLSDVQRTEFDNCIDEFNCRFRYLYESSKFMIFISDFLVKYSIKRFDEIVERIRLVSQKPDYQDQAFGNCELSK